MYSLRFVRSFSQHWHLEMQAICHEQQQFSTDHFSTVYHNIRPIAGPQKKKKNIYRKNNEQAQEHTTLTHSLT